MSEKQMCVLQLPLVFLEELFHMYFACIQHQEAVTQVVDLQLCHHSSH